MAFARFARDSINLGQCLANWAIFLANRVNAIDPYEIPRHSKNQKTIATLTIATSLAILP